MNYERFSTIDKATGIAISFVVFGHIIFPETLNLSWYDVSQHFIYKFHMPLFMCLSGYVVFLSTLKNNIISQSDYFKFQKKKIKKFLPPYLIFSLISILVDIFYHQATNSEVYDSLFSVFFSPNNGSAKFIWYLYVLTGFYIIAPFLVKLKSYSLYLLLAFGFLLTTFTPSHLFSADLVCRFFFFFLAGGLIFRNKDKFFVILKKNGLWILVFSVILIVVDLTLKLIIPFQLISVFIILSVLYVSSHKWPNIINNIFIMLGLSSFSIYILNTTILNVYYILFKSFLKLEINTFFIISSLLVAIFFSILIRFLFNKTIPSRIYKL